MYELEFAPIPEMKERYSPSLPEEERVRLAMALDENHRAVGQKRQIIRAAHESLADEYARSIGRDWWPRKYELTFSEPATLDFHRRKKVTGRQHTVKLFVSTHGAFAYTFHKTHGQCFSDELIRKLVKMRLITVEEEEEKVQQKLDQLVAMFHPNAWADVKRDLQNNPERRRYFAGLGLNLLDMRSRFSDQVIKELENAFRNQEDYHAYVPGRRRDIRVETQMGADGIFRAWYSSEYAGCGNGQYYILINPHYASFMERD
jgi:hypothetical protein